MRELNALFLNDYKLIKHFSFAMQQQRLTLMKI